eukprot:CAMPEP_0177654464 /NCGR_PEP_ID=MMETSP0447-20121125/14347_1 /TAXON_ID=0 /ORGANISM="Stygamoeba regulata, Strain BSH-02190019" /LENGTH=84 /DNA_ID=CAMNT_0019158117 /DNA_START=510 /DNA_END=761 /DNA_ORIENTATION=-
MHIGPVAVGTQDGWKPSMHTTQPALRQATQLEGSFVRPGQPLGPVGGLTAAQSRKRSGTMANTDDCIFILFALSFLLVAEVNTE